MISQRAKTNSRWGIAVALLEGLRQFGSFLAGPLQWDITALIEPQHLEAFVNGAWNWMLVYGGGAAIIRDMAPVRDNAGTTGDPATPVVPAAPTPPAPVVLAPEPPPKNYFSQAELECKGQTCDCTFPGMSAVTLRMANEVRKHFGVTFCNSGHRCEIHNRGVQGAEDSYHIPGRAMDIRCANAEPKTVYDWLCKRYPNRYGFGLYGKFVHIDDRGPDVYARKANPESEWIELPRRMTSELDMIL